MSGDVKTDEREKIIENFKNNQSVKLLLSSRVGSEGLDFQFCNTMFYDLHCDYRTLQLAANSHTVPRIEQLRSVGLDRMVRQCGQLHQLSRTVAPFRQHYP